MDIKIQKKIDKYICDFKEEIKNKMVELDLINNMKCNQLLQFIYDSDNLKITIEDFSKRKRNKNTIQNSERCLAKKSDGEQCSRKRKETSLFCGTHTECKDMVDREGNNDENNIKDGDNETRQITKNVVFAIDICGILYYLDNNGNVYMTEDILSNKRNPRIIAKYTKENDIFHIPEFGI